jgi:carbamoyl-phosphate synthase small subunit
MKTGLIMVADHPVQRRVAMITSQNHGFTVDEDTLPDNVKSTHRSLFDGYQPRR